MSVGPLRRCLHFIVIGIVALSFGTLRPSAATDHAEGRQLYVDTCAKCHGELTERRTSALRRDLLVLAVAPPLGPNLSGIFGRPAGTIEGFRYSNAFRRKAAGLVWDAPTLDRWLTDSQKMIRGSYMFLKVAQPARGKIIAYLKAYGRHRE